MRMYDVGFGDAFTISIDEGGATKTVLVDCGSIKQGSRPMSETVKALIADLPRVGGHPRIDLVVATHRHKDHVSGFGQAAWAQVDVGAAVPRERQIGNGLVPAVRAVQRVEHERGIGNRSRERADLVERPAERHAAVPAHAPVGRAEADDAARAGGRHDRAAGLGSNREADESR